MAHKEHGSATLLADLLHFAHALFLKLDVAHRHDLVHDQDFGFEVGSAGKSKTYIHARAVTLHWRIEKFLNLRESDALVELGSYLGSGHTQHGTIQKDLLATAQLCMEAGTDLENPRNTAADTDLPL